MSPVGLGFLIIGGFCLIISIIIIAVMRSREKKGDVGPIVTAKSFYPVLIIGAAFMVISFFI